MAGDDHGHVRTIAKIVRAQIRRLGSRAGSCEQRGDRSGALRVGVFGERHGRLNRGKLALGGAASAQTAPACRSPGGPSWPITGLIFQPDPVI